MKMGLCNLQWDARGDTALPLSVAHENHGYSWL